MAAQNGTDFFFYPLKNQTTAPTNPCILLMRERENAAMIYVLQIKLRENYLLPPLPKSTWSNRHFTHVSNYCVDQLTHRSEGGDELQQYNKQFTGMDTNISFVALL